MNILMSPGIYAVPITIEDINAYFKEKNLKDRCPQCDADLWNVSMPEQMEIGKESVSFLVAETRNFSSPVAHNAIVSIVFECANCGYVRFQLAKSIIEWKLSKKNERQSEI